LIDYDIYRENLKFVLRVVFAPRCARLGGLAVGIVDMRQIYIRAKICLANSHIVLLYILYFLAATIATNFNYLNYEDIAHN